MCLVSHPLVIVALIVLSWTAISVDASALSTFDIEKLRINNRASTLPPARGLKLLLEEHFLFNYDTNLSDHPLLVNVITSLKARDKYFRLLGPEQMEGEMERLDGMDYRFGFSIARRTVPFNAFFIAMLSAVVATVLCVVTALVWHWSAGLAPQYVALTGLTVTFVQLWTTYRQWRPLVLSEVDSSFSPHLAVGDRVVAVDGIGAAKLSSNDMRLKLKKQTRIELTLSRHKHSALLTAPLQRVTEPSKKGKEKGQLRKWLYALSLVCGASGAPQEEAVPAVTETARVVRSDGSVLVNVTVAKQPALAPSSVALALLPAVEGEPAVGYLKILEFNDQTYPAFTTALAQLRELSRTQRNVSLGALVCDLRGNRGGSLVAALDVAATFLPRGACLTQLRARQRIHVPRSKNHRPDLHTPLLVLVDRETASASEILVQALCDGRNGPRAISMGQPTRGKNYAQAMVSLSDGTGVCLSVCEFLTPSGRSMQGGHQPTILHCPADSLRPDRIKYDSSTRTWSLRSGH